MKIFKIYFFVFSKPKKAMIMLDLVNIDNARRLGKPKLEECNLILKSKWSETEIGKLTW